MKTHQDLQRPLWCLNNVNLFQHLGPEQMGALHRWVKTIHYGKGETVFLPGDPSDFVYFLHHGRVKLSYLDESGKRFTAAVCRQGELFGEMALLGESRRRLIAEALEDIALCIVSSRDLIEFMSAYPDLMLRVVKQLGTRMASLENRLEDVVFKDVPTRLARLLVRLSQEYGEASEEGVLLKTRLTHRDFADLIGSTRETTTATLSRFAKQGLVQKRTRHLLLCDLERLKQLAAFDHDVGAFSD